MLLKSNLQAVFRPKNGRERPYRKDHQTILQSLQLPWHGFIESIYHNSMVLEPIADGCVVESQKPIGVHYEGRIVGTFAAEIVVNELVIVELKAKERIIEPFKARLTNYLRATEIEIGLLLYFGKTPDLKRKYFSNSNKKLSANNNGPRALENLPLNDPFESA